MVDATDNAELWKQLVINQQEVISLQRNQMAHQETVAKELSAIKDILAQAKGGWKVFMIVGGSIGAIASMASWVYLNFFHVSPK